MTRSTLGYRLGSRCSDDSVRAGRRLAGRGPLALRGSLGAGLGRRTRDWARLFEDYGTAEPEDELLPSDYEPISSHGERPGELLDIDQLTTLMEEDIPGDLVAKLEADRDRYLATVPRDRLHQLAARLAAS